MTSQQNLQVSTRPVESLVQPAASSITHANISTPKIQHQQPGKMLLIPQTEADGSVSYLLRPAANPTLSPAQQLITVAATTTAAPPIRAARQQQQQLIAKPYAGHSGYIRAANVLSGLLTTQYNVQRTQTRYPVFFY